MRPAGFEIQADPQNRSLRVKAILHLLFSFRGRINRKQWWFGIGIGYTFSLCVTLPIYFSPKATWIVVLWIPALWIMLALHIKRSHDRNRPFWWGILVLIFCGAAGVLLTVLPGLRGIGLILWIIAFGCLPGDAGKNRYGPPPKPLFEKASD